MFQLAAAALRTLRPFLLVLYYMEADAERLPAFPAAIFVERHDSPPGGTRFLTAGAENRVLR